jgi:hypothetical protein
LKVSIAHLPQPGQHFVRRDEELKLLDEAWNNPRTNLIEFVAFGGVGKSALVAEWLKRMRDDHFRGAVRVFGHSFYSQGSREDAQASADSFLDQALRFFGDPDPTEGSPWDKGERLARLVREQSTLLILDGVEPLQSPSSADDAGQVRDPGLQAMIVELAASVAFRSAKDAHAGDATFAERKATFLTVISTRARVADIEGWEGSSVISHPLDHLSVDAGVALLKEIGVNGDDEELGEAVQEVGGHALCVTLVGKYVVNAVSGHVHDRFEIGLPRIDLVRTERESDEDESTQLVTAVTPDVQQMGHTLAPSAGQKRNPKHVARTFSRIMDRYEVWLSGLKDREGDVEVSGRLALEIVRLTGLFDRPITAGEFAALVTGVTIQPPREQTPLERAHASQNHEAAQMAFMQMMEQATEGEKLKIKEAIEASPQDIEALRTISQSIAERERSSDETPEAVTLSDAIPGLTDLASQARPEQVNLAIGSLVEYGLITKVTASAIRLSVPSWPDPAASEVVLDAHPLVREYFAKRIKDEGGRKKNDEHSSFREAHRRLYEHLKQSAPELPNNLNDMMPLYHAVAHGCKAALQVQSYEDVYLQRVFRGPTVAFSTKQLGAFGTDLAALSAFFTRHWTTVCESFSAQRTSYLLGNVAFRLRALGRLGEALEPMRTGLASSITQSDWAQAPIVASNLSELSLTLGDVSSAVRQGEQSVELADHSGDAFERMADRTTLAAALHASERMNDERGRMKTEDDASFILPPSSFASAAFREAEAMQQERQPQYPLLYSTGGYQYCELLLEQLAIRIPRFAKTPPAALAELQSEIESLRNRAETNLREQSNLGLLDIGLDHLTLGRTWLLESQLRGVERGEQEGPAPVAACLSALDSAQHHLTQSVTQLRQAGDQTHLPCGLLHRAALWRMRFEITNKESEISKAERDLDETEAIAERGSMLIWQIEAALERTRLAHALGDRDVAMRYLEKVRESIKETERAYEPHVPDWDEWKPPAYVNVIQSGQIVGYHCRNAEIERLERELHQA